LDQTHGLWGTLQIQTITRRKRIRRKRSQEVKEIKEANAERNVYMIANT
jgi:hypothetical protein